MRWQGYRSILGGVSAIGVGVCLVLIAGEIGWFLPAIFLLGGVGYFGYGVYVLFPKREGVSDARTQAERARGINRKVRLELSAALNEFAAGRTDAWEFNQQWEAHWCGSRDQAVAAIYRFAWQMFPCSDEVVAALPRMGLFPELGPGRKEQLDRCRLFLQTDHPYRWPRGYWRMVLFGVLYLGMALGLVSGLAGVFNSFTPPREPEEGFSWGLRPGLLSLEGAALAVLVMAWSAWRGEKQFRRAGDEAVWPFQNQEEYQRASAG